MKQVGEIPPVLISYTLFSPFHIFRRGRRPQRPLWPSDGTKIRAVKGLPLDSSRETKNCAALGFFSAHASFLARGAVLPLHILIGSITADFGQRQEGQMAVEGPSYFFVRISYGKKIKGI